MNLKWLIQSMPTAKHGSGEDDDESIIFSFPRVRLEKSDLEDWLMSRATLSIPQKVSIGDHRAFTQHNT